MYARETVVQNQDNTLPEEGLSGEEVVLWQDPVRIRVISDTVWTGARNMFAGTEMVSGGRIAGGLVFVGVGAYQYFTGLREFARPFREVKKLEEMARRERIAKIEALMQSEQWIGRE